LIKQRIIAIFLILIKIEVLDVVIMPAIPVLRRLRQKDFELEFSSSLAA
jgi:hypothetical protein